MHTLDRLIKEIYDIIQEDLSANCREIDHLEYIKYRLNGGIKDEEEWFSDESYGKS